jgi:hypothetical protein
MTSGDPGHQIWARLEVSFILMVFALSLGLDLPTVFAVFFASLQFVFSVCVYICMYIIWHCSENFGCQVPAQKA